MSTPESGTTAAHRHRRTQVPFPLISSQLWTVSAIIDYESSERCFFATKMKNKSAQSDSIQFGVRTHLLVCVKPGVCRLLFKSPLFATVQHQKDPRSRHSGGLVRKKKHPNNLSIYCSSLAFCTPTFLSHST